MPRRQEKEKLKFLRQEILATDQRILELIFHRIEISQEIGRLKVEMDMPIENLERERLVLDAGLEVAKTFNLDETTTKSLLESLIKLCKEKQNQLKNFIKMK